MAAAPQGNALSGAARSKDAPQDASAADASPVDDELYVRGVRGRRIAVELCMKEELMAGQRQLERLARAYLPDAAVCSVGPPGEVAQRAGAIAVLDLQVRMGVATALCRRGVTHSAVKQAALLPDWPSVARLNEELPALQVLDLRCGAAAAAGRGLRRVADVLLHVVWQSSAQRVSRRARCGRPVRMPAHAGAQRHGCLLAAGA